jgi:hypothetical protein
MTNEQRLKTYTTLVIRRDDHAKLKAIAKASHRSMSSEMSYLIEKEIENLRRGGE